MKYAKLDVNIFALRLDPGDDIHTSIQDFCARQNITNAAVEGIGSVETPTLAHYSIKTKQFTNRDFPGIFEITSLLGNVALMNGQPFAHLHATLAGPDFQAIGGHLVKGQCSATLELIVTAHSARHHKSPDDAIGLATWDFEGAADGR